jgi:hypothetical protein
MKRLSNEEVRRSPAVRRYTILALIALLVLFLGLMELGLGIWGLLPLLAGSLAVALHWTTGPPLVLVTTAFLVNWSQHVFVPWRRRLGHLFSLHDPGFLTETGPPFVDLLLCIALLGYVVAQYRLLALVHSILPRDARRRSGDDRPTPQRRSPDQVSDRELERFALLLPLWTALAYGVWAMYPSQASGPLGLNGEVWRIFLIVWTIGVGTLATAVVVGYLGWTNATAAEAQLYLQDQLWRQTRREQSRLNHWITWARLRRQRREERS